MKSNYPKAYTEILEIMKYLPKEEFARIPQEKIGFYKENCDKDYKFVFDISKSFEEQNILKETNALIVLLFRNYFATEEQKKKLDKLLIQNEEEHQKELREKYNSDNIFKQSNKEIVEQQEQIVEPVAMIEYKENIFKRIINKIKSIFGIK